MNRAQRFAWVGLLTAVSMGLSYGTVFILTFIIGMPDAWLGMLFMLLMGLTYFIKEDSRDKVEFDERDVLIQQRAGGMGTGASYAFFVVFSSIVYFVAGKGGTVPAVTLFAMTLLGVIVGMFVYSISILVQYGWGVKGEKS